MTDFLRNFSWKFLFTLRVFARNLLKGNRQRNTFRILFQCLALGSNPGFSSNMPIHYLLDHGDFTKNYFFDFFCSADCVQTLQADLYTHRVFARNLLKVVEYIFSHISFWCLTWDLNRGLTSYKPTHYLLDYGEFFITIIPCNLTYWVR